MGNITLPGLCEKHGRLYFRRKVAGKDTYIRLPPLTDPSFAEAYQRAAHVAPAKAAPRAGTFAALVCAYRRSSEYKSIRRESTRTNKARYLAMIEEEHGSRTVSGCRPSDVRRMRDAYADTPGKANNWLSIFKELMAWASMNDWRKDNPAVDVKRLPGGEHEPWPADLLERALEVASPMLRLTIIVALCTGARVSDCIRFQHGWIDGGVLQFVSVKTHTDVAVPVHPLLVSEISKIQRRSVSILYDRMGKPFGTEGAIQSRIRTLMRDLGSPSYVAVNGRRKAYSMHGLRKNAACYLAELGLSDGEIGALLGMTPDTVRHYTKRARAFMIARGASERVTSADVLPISRASRA